MRDWAWLDSMIDNWRGILLGSAGALAFQAVLGLMTGVAEVPLQPVIELVVVELSVGLGAFLAGLFATEAPATSGLAVALVLALMSLVAFSFLTPLGGDLSGLAFLLGSYALIGLLGGLTGGRVQEWWQRRHAR